MSILTYAFTINTETGEATFINPEENAPIEYAEDGYSIDTRHGCCYRSLEIDSFLDEKLQSQDEYERAVASQMPRWFALLIPGRTISDDAEAMLSRNWNLSYSWGAFRLSGFYPEARRNPDGSKHFGEPFEGVSMPKYGMNLGRMHLSLLERLPMHFNSKVREMKHEGVDIADIYRDKYR